MAHRHLSRSVVLQTLFEKDFGGDGVDLVAALKRNSEEFAPGMSDFVFMEKLLTGVIEHERDLDTIISKAAPDWPIEKISVVDRNVLRLGLYELLFANRDEVPAKVAINEAIELAKAFGGDSSGKFVNGVLGTVYKEIGEPGKNETTKKKPTEIKNERLGGAVVYARHEGELFLAFVHDVFGKWTLSKGGLEGDEDEREGTAREIKKELGLDVVIHDDLGMNEYIASHPEKGKVRKRVHYFLAEAPYQELALSTSGGLDDARWFRMTDVVHLTTYDDILPVITKAVNLLVKV